MSKEQNPNSQPEKDTSETVANNNQNSKKGKKVNKILLAIIVILVVAIFVLAYILLHRNDKKPTDGRATFVSQDNVEDVKKHLTEKAVDTYYQASMSIDWYFDNGKAASTGAYVENSTENTRTVYFDVHLQKGDLVYSSPYLPVGEKMKEITLEKNLDAGDYPATVTYHLVDDNHKELSTVAVAITIHVLN